MAGLDHAPLGVLGSDGGLTITYANPAACALLGYEREELLGLGLQAIHPDLDREGWKAPALETTLAARDGSRIPVELTRARISGPDGDTLFLYIRDITASRASGAALRKSESRFALAFNASPDAINLARLDDGTYLEVSPGFERLSGWKREEALGRTPAQLDLWAEPDGRQRMNDLLRGKGDFDNALFRFRRRNGTVFKGMMSGRMVSMDGLPCVLTITRDVTLQVDAQEALGNLTDLLSAITANVPAFISLLDQDCRLLFVNRLVEGRTMDDVIGSDFRNSISPDVRAQATEAVARILAGSERETYEGWGWGPERKSKWYRSILGPMKENGQVVGVVLISMDETDRRSQEVRIKEVEEALRQAQKLESLGVMAGGIAHDFNNLLTAIMGNLNLAQLKLPEDSPALRHLGAVESTVLKASDLTRQMLAYSGKGRFSVKPQDFNAVVEDLIHLLKVTVNKKAVLEIRLASDLPAMEGDGAQLQQVVMNLVTNASDALGDGEGLIRVATRLETLDAEGIRAAFPAQDLEPGPFVVLEVADTGCGMSSQVMAKIFDPFFTTKVKGRGLGLSAMLGILKGHKAGIRIRSRVGEGSTFQVYFPASMKALPRKPREEGAPFVDFHGTVLLVDDEASILDSISQALEAMGFAVIRAQDGQEALERFEAAGPELVLVVMDLTMPRMDGATAFRKMQALRPGVPVVLSSGYDRQALHGVHPAAFVQKPYRLADLRRLIQDVLGQDAGRA